MRGRAEAREIKKNGPFWGAPAATENTTYLPTGDKDKHYTTDMQQPRPAQAHALAQHALETELRA